MLRKREGEGEGKTSEREERRSDRRNTEVRRSLKLTLTAALNLAEKLQERKQRTGQNEIREGKGRKRKRDASTYFSSHIELANPEEIKRLGSGSKMESISMR